MATFKADQNQLIFRYESGTYASASGGGHWIGQVISHNLTENVNTVEHRYFGNQTRDVNQFFNVVKDFDGTFTFHPQDWKFLMFALGSNVDAGSPSPYTHTISAVNSASGNAFTSGTENPFISFTLEDSQKNVGTGRNFIRTVKGAMVDTLTLSATNREAYQVEVSYIAQNVDFSSGAVTAIADKLTTRPFLFSDTKLHIPSGTVVATLTEHSLQIMNNLKRNNYNNGSDVTSAPTPQDRSYKLNCTIEGDSETFKTFYDQYYIGGSEFNAILEVNASTGSRDMFLFLSGCKMTNFNAPEDSPTGVNTQTLEITPKTVDILVNDTIELYNPW